MISKYTLNQLVFWFNSIGYLTTFYLATRVSSPTFKFILFGLSIIHLHYLLDLVHIASHNVLSKNRRLNSIYGNLAGLISGVTLADFRTTHLLHHRFLSDPTKDPDHFITTSGPWFTIPFKIYYHDVYFWKHGLWKQQNSWKSYFATRFIQIGLVTALITQGYQQIWINHWVIPMLLLGLSNGLFLFYLPHYVPRIEKFVRARPNIFNFPLRAAIDISRIYHEKHHDRIQANINYYPVIASITHFLKHRNFKFDFHYKYTESIK